MAKSDKLITLDLRVYWKLIRFSKWNFTVGLEFRFLKSNYQTKILYVFGLDLSLNQIYIIIRRSIKLVIIN